MGKFDGKVAIVTGAGRMRGIGRSAALAFAREGASVTVTGTGRDPNTFPLDEREASWRDVDSVAAEVEEMGAGSLPMVVDVSRAEDVQRMVDSTVERFGRVDFLVNNAAAPRMAAWAPLTELSTEAWQKVFDIKVTGTFLCTRAVSELLVRQGSGGSIVNVISIEAKISRDNDVAYATASGALYTFTAKGGKALALLGIRMNGVSPGTTDTSRNDALYGYPRDDVWESRVKTIPMGRAASPDDLANLIAWLCSDEAYMIAGKTIEVDGGQAS